MIARPAGNDILRGGNRDDNLFDRQGHDRIVGGPGDELIAARDERSAPINPLRAAAFRSVGSGGEMEDK